MTEDPLAQSRLDGGTISGGCLSCPLLKVCGGYPRVGAAWSCMDHCEDCDPATCDLVCLRNHHFVRDFAEVEGFGLALSEHLVGVAAGRLPRYVPVIEHGNGREEEIIWPLVALPMRRILKLREGLYGPVASSPECLRDLFRVSRGTEILLLGTGPDRPLERLWRYGRAHGVASKLAGLNLACAIPPNFSHALNHPRPTHLANMKRSALVASDLSAAGLPVIPYASATTEHDYNRLELFLREHPSVETIAEEFRTGLKRPDRALPVLRRLARMQDALQRRLHPVAIGGAQYGQELANLFESFTVVDSQPFFKAVKRQVGKRTANRYVWELRDEDVGAIAYHNIALYSRVLEAMVPRPRVHLRVRP